MPLAVLLHSALNYDQPCALLSPTAPFPMPTAGFLEDGLWEISDDFGERNPVERWEKSNSLMMFGVFLASGKSFKPRCEAGSRKNTEVLHLVLQGRKPLFACSNTNEKEGKKGFSTFNLILQAAAFATGHSVLLQFLSRKDCCECHTCLALSQV